MNSLEWTMVSNDVYVVEGGISAQMPALVATGNAHVDHYGEYERRSYAGEYVFRILDTHESVWLAISRPGREDSSSDRRMRCGSIAEAREQAQKFLSCPIGWEERVAEELNGGAL